MYIVVYTMNILKILQTDEFSKWMKRLRDANARARINVRIRRISLTGNFGDAKPVGDGVYELLIGGDKSSQQKDIDKAKKLNAEYEG